MVLPRKNELWPIFSGALFEWNEDKAPRMAAALAFYTLFSLAPIIIIAIAVGGLAFDRQRALAEVLDQVQFLVGEPGTDAIELLLENAPEQQASRLAMLAGLLTMFFAATGAFAELKDSLNTIWEVQPRPGLGLLELIRDRMLSFALVLVIGFFLLVSLVTSALLSALYGSLSQYTDVPPWLLESGHSAMSLAGITFLFALIYKMLPDARVLWRDVWLGAALAAVLFVMGKLLFGIYLGHSTIGSSYGAAGSLVIVILWTYYSALILLFGAEISQVQARVCGERIVPQPNAVHLTEHARLQQGLPHLEEVERAAREAAAESASADPPPGTASGRPAVAPGRNIVTAGLGFLAGWWLGKHRRD